MAVIIVPMGHVSGSDDAAHKIACNNLFKLYDAKTATVQQMQEYASCVRFVYPNGDPAQIKAVVFIALLFVLIGCVVGYIRRDDFFDDGFWSAIGGGIFGLLGFAIAGALFAAIAYIVS